ncbi:unnamed protein product [Dicrocoelium dendriticum]|nr:unnamed protein product [Dicrocoelium dendriticum]
MVEAHVRQAVLTNISEWMDLNNKTTESDRWSACYNVAYRFAPVQVQWNSTVREGDAVVMYGLLNGRHEEEDLKCMRNWKPIQWHDHIALSPNPVGNYFTITIAHAIYSDTGIYECRPDHTVTSQREFWGLGPRWLRVIPDSSKTTKCGLSVDKAGSKRLRNGGQAINGLDYLMAGEKAYVTCMFETGFAEFYRPVFRLKHHMLDTSTGHSEPADITFNIVVSSHASGTFTTYVYEIEGIRSRFYKGPLTATCEAVIKLHHVDEGSTRQHVVSCQQTYAVLEPANGEVLIETLSKDYESQPVPLGTEFKCTGGYGSPPLKHSWTPNNIGQYERISSVRVPDTSNPGDHHDWIGPRQTFTDQPTNGLLIKEDKLLIPYDRRYRGMSYLYTCWGNNSIEDEVWSVRKTIRFTVMICPTRVVPLDLTILLSSRLLSRCTLEGNPDREIQFYGHFYLPLIQQLILGLPYGPTQVQFHFIRDVVFDHNTSISFPLTAFNQQLSREQLLRTVNPMDWKPKTDPGGCGASPIIFDSVFAHLARLRHVPPPGREHVLVLPFDDFTDIRISNETSSLLSMLLRTNMTILLLSTVGQGARGSAIIHKLEDLLSPVRTINILPNFDGDTDCLKCRPRLEAVTFRIARDKIFDTVCEATGILLPDSCPAPALHFSIPSRHWYNGQHLGITCTANLSRPFRGQTVTGVAICLINGTVLQSLEQRPLNIQHLMNACNKELANRVTSVISEPSEFSVSAQLWLRKWKGVAPLLMCYQRQGNKDPQLTDIVNYSTATLTVLEPNWRTPSLTVKWPTFETGAAVLDCHLSGFAPRSEVLMLLAVDANGRFYIVARRKVAFNPLGEMTIVHIGWHELWPPLGPGKLFCLIQPMSTESHKQRVLSRMPVQSDLVGISQPVTRLRLPDNCPSAPKVWTEPSTGDRLLPQGSQLDMRCEGAVTTHRLPLKMYYLTANFSLVVCAVDGAVHRHGDVSTTTANQSIWIESEHVCTSVTTEDQTCSQRIRGEENWFSLYYETSCGVKWNPTSLEVFRSIRLTIKQLRHVDFMALSFCEPIILQPTRGDQTKSTPDLTSDSIIVRFELPPQITNFYFDPKREYWFCETYSFPSINSGLIKVLQASPPTLAKQLRLRTTEEDRTPPSLKDPQLASGRTKPYLNYYFRLVFKPRSPTHVRLRRGEAMLRCVFHSLHKDLHTSVGMIGDDPVVQHPEILLAGDAMDHDCSMATHLELAHITLHRLIRYTWLHYDLSVAMFPLRPPIKYSSVVRPETQWTIQLLHPSSRLTRNSGVSIIMDEDSTIIFVHPISEFDHGEYYCTGMTVNNTILRTNPRTHLIHGMQKHFAFGVRVQDVQKVWSSVCPTVLLGQVAQFRCSIWSTNPAGRLVTHFRISSASQNEKLHSVYLQATHPHGVILGEISVYVNVTSGNFANDFVCHFSDRTIAMNRTIHPVKAACTTPNLEWSPSDKKEYGVDDEISCEVRGGCEHVRARWTWVAGPIPQLVPESYDQAHLLSSSSNKLILKRLLRSGNYLFRCIATCECPHGTMRNSILVTLYVNIARDQEIGSVTQGLEWDRSDITGITSTSDTTVSNRRPDYPHSLVEHWSESHYQDLKTDGGTNVPSKAPEPQAWVQLSTVDSTVESTDDFPIPDELRAHSSSQTEDGLKQTFSWHGHMTTADRLVSTGFVTTSIYQRRPLSKLGQPVQTDKLDGVYSEAISQVAAAQKDRMGSQAVDAVPWGKDEGRTSVSSSIKGLYSVVERLRAPKTRHFSHRRGGISDDELLPLNWLQSMRDDIPRGVFATARMMETRPEGWRVIRNVTERSPENQSSGGEVSVSQSRKRIWSSVDLVGYPMETQMKESEFHIREPVVRSKGVVVPMGTLRSVNEMGLDGISVSEEPPESTPMLWIDVNVRSSKLEENRKASWTIREADLYPVISTRGQQPQRYRLQRDRGVFGMKYLPADCCVHQECTLWGKSHWNFDGQSHIFHWVPLEQRSWIQETAPSYPERRCGRMRIDASNDQNALRTAVMKPEILTGVNDMEFAWDPGKNVQPQTWYTTRSRLVKEHLRNSLVPWRLEKQELDVILDTCLVVLPASISARCPDLTGEWFTTYRPVQITWTRQPYLHNIQSSDVEELVQFSLIERRVRTLSPRGQMSKRLFLYPEHKWSTAHTLDMKVETQDDYGFYGCTATLQPLRREGGLLNVSKTSPKPLCIIPSIIQPNITIDHLGNGSKESKSKCLRAGDEILIRCTDLKRQMFCEHVDMMTHGYRSIKTRLRAYLYLLRDTKSYRVIQVSNDSDEIEPLDLFSNQTARTWKMTVDASMRDAYVTCTSHLELAPPSSGRPVYWDWLEYEFTLRQARLSRRSQAIHICVEQGGDTLQFYPSPLDGKLTLRPGQLLTCSSSTASPDSPVITVYSVSGAKIHSATHYSLLRKTRCVERTWDSPVFWRNSVRPGTARLFVPRTERSRRVFCVSCAQTSTNTSQHLILFLQDEQQLTTRFLTISAGCVLVSAFLLRCLMKYLKLEVSIYRYTRPSLRERQHAQNCPHY